MIRLIFLYPISFVINLIVLLRNLLYDYSFLHKEVSKKMVISVGNIQIGGAGKTPFVISLIKLLLDNHIKPLVITRGYKRITSKQIIFEHINDYTVEEVGDEPYHIKMLFEDVPIIINQNKKQAVRLANTLKNIDCIILDDGYQSRYIKRDLDIVLINTWKNNESFKLAPLGFLREKVNSLKRADIIYTTKGDNFFKKISKYETYPLNIDYQLTEFKKNKIVNVKNIKSDKSKKIIAFSGIANSNHFQDTLNNMNIKYDKIIHLKNHYNYKSDNNLIIDNENIIYITTYKDFFKLNLKNALVYIVNMEIHIKHNMLIDKIKKRINETNQM